jgi:hypothetical protein
MKNAAHNLPPAGALGEQLPPIDSPPFCPAWPKRNTLADRALKWLLDGRVLDHPDGLKGAGSWRRAAVVFQQRALGWPIDTIEVPRPSKEHPGRTIALYKLPATYAAEALAQLAGGVQ